LSTRNVILSLVLLMGASLAADAATPPAPARSITQVTGDLYRASNGNWNTVFLVTPAGIVLADPLNVEFAAWLKAQLDERFKLPVRYVIYSHSHWDHAEGGNVFATTATFIGHENMLVNMDGRVPHMPGGFVDLDDNHAFEPDEIRDRPTHPDYRGVCGSNFFARLDIDRDGHVTPAEYHANIRRPDIAYSERMTLVLGGKTIELFHPGKNHANDGTVFVFPAERAVFSADFPADALVTASMRSMPSACGNFDGHPLSEWVKSYRAIEALDFDVLVQGHGAPTFAKTDVTEGRQYFEDLIAAVTAGMARGLGPDELKQTVRLEKYRSWQNYDRLLEDNVMSAYYNLKLYR
jgi:glyoxylase-like metal-dependent hydrolase (beta-lactamase superfamily II)